MVKREIERANTKKGGFITCCFGRNIVPISKEVEWDSKARRNIYGMRSLFSLMNEQGTQVLWA